MRVSTPAIVFPFVFDYYNDKMDHGYQWYLDDDDIPSSTPHVVPAPYTSGIPETVGIPTILVVGSGRSSLGSTTWSSSRAKLVIRRAVDIPRYVDYVRPIGAILVRAGASRRDYVGYATENATEDNMAATILSAHRIPFITCGDLPRATNSTTLLDAPYFELADNLDTIVEYLLATGNPATVVRRRGISRAKL